jgi:hypothetical protein
LDRGEHEGVLIAIGGHSVTDDDARIANRSRNGQRLETGLRGIAQRVQIVHLVGDVQKRVFGIIAGSRGTDDHAGGICAVADNAGSSGGVTAERSEIGNSECELALSSR